MTTLLMSSRHTEDDQVLWRAAIGRGWSVARARGIRLPEIEDREVVIYVEAMFAPAIAKMIGRRLLDPPEDWLVKMPLGFRKREVRLVTLGQARAMNRPNFMKPPNDKSFAAQVYSSGADLPLEFDDDMPVLVADPVRWESEFRCFCLDRKVVTVSPYLRSGTPAKETGYDATALELTDASKFAEDVLDAAHEFTPRAVVIDVGLIVNSGWAVVEANGAWGSGIYGCDPNFVLDVIRHATLQPDQKGV
jgi:ATP-grasp domain, R2K clade family 2